MQHNAQNATRNMQHATPHEWFRRLLREGTAVVGVVAVRGDDTHADRRRCSHKLGRSLVAASYRVGLDSSWTRVSTRLPLLALRCLLPTVRSVHIAPVRLHGAPPVCVACRAEDEHSLRRMRLDPSAYGLARLTTARSVGTHCVHTPLPAACNVQRASDPMHVVPNRNVQQCSGATRLGLRWCDAFAMHLRPCSKLTARPPTASCEDTRMHCAHSFPIVSQLKPA
jgi:hypothetical protein